MTGWQLGRGARLLGSGRTAFAVWAPRATSVTVTFPSPPRRERLETCGGGVFEGTFDATAGEDYCFRLDDGPALPDPVSRFQPLGVLGPSRIVDPKRFAWTDAGWRGLSMRDLVLYELHVGTFTPEGTLEAAARRFRDLADLGVTAVEPMPLGAFPGSRNWGYDGVFPYAVQESYGGPEAFRRFVDAAHGAGLAVVLDVVYNHLGPEGNVLAAYGPYFTDRYRTPWGAAINFDGPDSDEVRRYFVDNARYWIDEFHVDGLRLDAVHAILDVSPRHILEEIADAVHQEGERQGRSTLAIAESDANDPRLARPVERGGYGLDGIWSDDLHHAIHALLTGERSGYYVDFGGTRPVAKVLSDGFALDGVFSIYRRRRHGAPAHDLPREAFVTCLQNHDQVGNRALGERLAALVAADVLRIGAVLNLLAPFVPLIFMGEEHAETCPFLYFTSHQDPALVEAVREGRREELRAFHTPGEVPDPQAPETFERSRVDWSKRELEPNACHRHLYRDLLALRQTEPALAPGGDVEVSEDGESIVIRRRRDGSAVIVVVNLSETTRPSPVPDAAVLLSTAWREYGGPGDDAGDVPPRSAVVYRERGKDGS